MRYFSIVASILSLSLVFANNGKRKYLLKYIIRIRTLTNPDIYVGNCRLNILKNSTLGVDIIESVFDTCDDKETEEGLTLTELKKDHCMSLLTLGFGIQEEDIEKNFEAIDKDGDGLISKQESVKAYQTLGLDRINSNNNLHNLEQYCT